MKLVVIIFLNKKLKLNKVEKRIKDKAGIGRAINDNDILFVSKKLTIPAALNTDGDIAYLQAHNTVTIINT